MALKVTYWTASISNPNVPGAIISSESIALSGTSAQSGTTPANAVYVSVYGTEYAAFDYSSSNPTAVAAATGTSGPVGSGERVWLDAVPGYKVAGIQGS